MLSISPARSSGQETAEGGDELGHALSGFGGDGQNRLAGGGAKGSEVVGGFREVGLVGGDEKRAPGESGVVLAQLLAEEAIILRWVSSLRAGGIDDEEEHGAAFDMAEKVVAETLAGVGAFDESGDIGDGEAVFLGGADDADGGVEGGEGVGGDLGYGDLS